MDMKHVLLEVYCDYNVESQGEKSIRCNEIGINCFKTNCKHLSYTICPHEIAYTGINGCVESFNDCVGFGGEMEPEANDSYERDILLEKWKLICKMKIDEAYEEYMNFKNNK